MARYDSEPIPRNSRQLYVDLAAARHGAPAPYTTDHAEAEAGRALRAARRLGSPVLIVRYGPRPLEVLGAWLGESMYGGGPKLKVLVGGATQVFPAHTVTVVDLPAPATTRCPCGAPLAAGHTFCSATCEAEAAPAPVERRCYCPDDCGCRRPHRPNSCGCRCSA